jgi:hypothetical protein
VAMRRAVSGFLFLLMIAVVPLSANQTKLVDDVIRMSRAGVGDDTIVAFVNSLRDRPAVTADEVIAMKAAGVSDTVIRAMVSQPSAPAQTAGEPSPRNPGGDGAVMPDMPPPDQTPIAESGGCVVFEPPFPIYYDPPYPSWLWDPNWYMPTLDAKGGTNSMGQHGGRPGPVPDSALSAIARGAAEKASRERPPAREDATRQRPARDTQSRDSGSNSRSGSSRHR